MIETDLAFKALGDPLRLRILAFLHRPDADCCSNEAAVCACDFEGVLGLSQPTISHHMKLLVQAGLVHAEKRGRWVHYSLNHANFRALAAVLLDYGGDPVPDGQPWCAVDAPLGAGKQASKIAARPAASTPKTTGARR
jgi:ArsR family transcriptional regulator